jgi:hypothetical protein
MSHLRVSPSPPMVINFPDNRVCRVFFSVYGNVIQASGTLKVQSDKLGYSVELEFKKASFQLHLFYLSGVLNRQILQ